MLNMKLHNIVIAGLALASLVACEPMEDFNDELKDAYQGPISQDITYSLSPIDYGTISETAQREALNEEEALAAANILEGDTALTGDMGTAFIPDILNSASELQGFGSTSIVSVTYKFRDNVESASRDTTQSFFKQSLYAWIPMPDAGYAYDFEDGTDYEDVNRNGWAQYFNGGIEDRTFAYRSYGGNRYAQVTAYSSGTVLDETVDVWLVSPALNLDEVYVAKNVRFNTSQAYANGAQLIAYVMDAQDPAQATLVEELTDAVIADDSQNNYTFVNSGELDLSAYSGTVYIAFQYLAEPGQTTTFQVDDFEFDFLVME